MTFELFEATAATTAAFCVEKFLDQYEAGVEDEELEELDLF